MLVMTRKTGEEVKLRLPPGYVVPAGGLEITVVLTWAANGRARIGFDALMDVEICRPDAVCQEPRR